MIVRTVALGCVMLLVCVSGCRPAPDTRLTQDNFDSIRPDMTTAQVQALLGEPAEKAVHATTSNDAEWLWQDGDRSIRVMFTPSGKVMSRGLNVVKEAKNLAP